MNLDDLSAKELAAIDAICLKFERAFATDDPLATDQAVEQLDPRSLDLKKRSPKFEMLKQALADELEQIQQELICKQQDPPVEKPPEPFQAHATPQKQESAPKQESESSREASQGVKRDAPAGTPGRFADAPSGSSDLRSEAKLAQTAFLSPEKLQLLQSGSGEASGEDSNEGAEVRKRLIAKEIVASQTSVGEGGGVKHQAARTIGPYQLGGVLARGGMSVVFQATDTRLNRPVAIKMLGFPHLSPSDPKRIDLVERFEREARAVAALSHPNIVELFDVGVAEGVPYAVMEFLSGKTLADAIIDGPMPLSQTRRIGMEIAGALATAHAGGVVHRDLKPQNVMVVAGENAADPSDVRTKLVDFGLSRVTDSDVSDGQGSVSTGAKTRVGTILGTPGYMAPEQARGESATSAADVFGFGCVLYEVFYGRAAIPGNTPADRLAQTLRGEVLHDPPQCELSKTLCDLINETLRQEPTERPTAKAIYQRLRDLESSDANSAAAASSIGASSPDLPIPARLQSSGGNSSPPPMVGAESVSSADVELSMSWSRRHLMAVAAGTVVGGLSGVMPSSSAFDYSKIRSIAVLTFVDANQGSSALDRTGMPLGGRSIKPGEALAAALVNQLSKVDSLEVRPYRPLTAESENDFYRLSSELDVKAFVTGTFGMQASDSGPVWVMRWKLVGERGHELTSGTYIKRQVPNQLADQMLAQQEVASQIAQEIDRILVTDRVQPPPQVYACLVKGHAQADTDSTQGLREALACYSHALENNPTQIEPLAAQAVTMLALAARSDRDESFKLIGEATQSMKDAIVQDPTSVDARLAQAIIEWQRLGDFQRAYDLFEQLLVDSPYHWSVHHQFGLLLETIGQDSRAQNLLQRASKLNSLSMLVRTDLVRAKWFNGYTVHSTDTEGVFLKGIPKPSTLMAKFGNPATKWVEGLLIDVLEEQRAYHLVGELLQIDPFANNERSYFRWRDETLAQHPYGPFGDVLNQAILDSRRNDGVDASMIGVMNEANALLFPLLFARHPAMRGLRALPDAKDFLPAPPETFLLDPANRT